MESLKNNGIKAKMLVRDKQTDQISVVRLKVTGCKCGSSCGNGSLSGVPIVSADTICSTLT